MPKRGMDVMVMTIMRKNIDLYCQYFINNINNIVNIVNSKTGTTVRTVSVGERYVVEIN